MPESSFLFFKKTAFKIQYLYINDSISAVRFQPNFGFGGGQNPNRMQGIDQRFGGSPGFMPSRQELKKPYGSM